MSCYCTNKVPHSFSPHIQASWFYATIQLLPSFSLSLSSNKVGGGVIAASQPSPTRTMKALPPRPPPTQFDFITPQKQKFPDSGRSETFLIGNRLLISGGSWACFERYEVLFPYVVHFSGTCIAIAFIVSLSTRAGVGVKFGKYLRNSFTALSRQCRKGRGGGRRKARVQTFRDMQIPSVGRRALPGIGWPANEYSVRNPRPASLPLLISLAA